MPQTSTNPAPPSPAKPAARRYDPRHRNPKGLAAGGLTDVINGNPNLVYRLVNPGDKIGGMEHYANLGYEVEKFRKGGVKLKIGPTVRPGEPLTFMGQVLMSIHKETHQDLVDYGAYGTGGQIRADEVDKALIKNRNNGGPDLLRGIRSSYITAVNDIQATEEEFRS